MTTRIVPFFQLALLGWILLYVHVDVLWILLVWTCCCMVCRNLPFKISSDEMYDIFGKYGPIRQIRLGSKNDTRGTAFVVYEDILDAKSACDHLSGFNVGGRSASFFSLFLVFLRFQFLLSFLPSFCCTDTSLCYTTSQTRWTRRSTWRKRRKTSRKWRRNMVWKKTSE